MKQTEVTDTNQVIAQWMRVMLYERDYRRDSVYRIGTIYGKDLKVLSTQVGTLLQRKLLPSGDTDLKIDRASFEIRLPLSPLRELFLTFEIPGNHNPRSKAQTFGGLCRGVQESIAERSSRRTKPSFLI